MNCFSFLFTWQGLKLQGSVSASEAKAGYSLNTLPKIPKSKIFAQQSQQKSNCHCHQNLKHVTIICIFFHFFFGQVITLITRLPKMYKKLLLRKYLSTSPFQCFLVRRESFVKDIICDHYNLEKCTQEAHIFSISLLASCKHCQRT